MEKLTSAPAAKPLIGAMKISHRPTGDVPAFSTTLPVRVKRCVVMNNPFSGFACGNNRCWDKPGQNRHQNQHDKQQNHRAGHLEFPFILTHLPPPFLSLKRNFRTLSVGQSLPSTHPAPFPPDCASDGTALPCCPQDLPADKGWRWSAQSGWPHRFGNRDQVAQLNHRHPRFFNFTNHLLLRQRVTGSSRGHHQHTVHMVLLQIGQNLLCHPLCLGLGGSCTDCTVKIRVQPL